MVRLFRLTFVVAVWYMIVSRVGKTGSIGLLGESRCGVISCLKVRETRSWNGMELNTTVQLNGASVFSPQIYRHLFSH